MTGTIKNRSSHDLFVNDGELSNFVSFLEIRKVSSLNMLALVVDYHRTLHRIVCQWIILTTGNLCTGIFDLFTSFDTV